MPLFLPHFKKEHSMDTTRCHGVTGFPECEACPHYRIDLDDTFGLTGDAEARRLCPELRPDVARLLPPVPRLVKFLKFLRWFLQ